MKALTLWQPWATLVAIGAKRIETRSWPTDYRGPLAIHAATRFPREAKELCDIQPFRAALLEAGYGNDIHVVVSSRLPRGVIVATCELVGIVRIEGSFLLPREPELSFGDFTPGRYAWFLDDVKELLEPVPARGRQRLWEWAE